jgi:hypothetical protein
MLIPGNLWNALYDIYIPVFGFIAAIELGALWATVYGWIGYQGRSKPIWLVLLTFALVVVIPITLVTFYSFWYAHHAG